MKGLLKFVLFLVVMVLFLGGSGYLIFSYDEVTGMLWAIGLWFVPFALFIVALVALVVGKLPKLGIRSRWSATTVFFTSLLAGLTIVLLAFGNAFVIQIGNVNDSVEEKVRWYARLTGQTTMQENAYKMEGEYATYYVTEDNEHKVAEIEELFPRMEEQLNRYLPPMTSGDKPEIELHQSSSTLSVIEMGPMTAGVYNILTGRIDLHANIYDWKSVLIHEYTHYRVHQFQLQEVGKHVAIPHWLEEGFAQVMTGTLPLGPFEVYEDFTLEDATSKIRNMNSPTHDVYTYGQIINLELTKTVSKEQFQSWLLTKDNSIIEQEIREIYEIPDTVPTHEYLIETYQTTLSKDPEYFKQLNEITTAEVQDLWEEYKKEMYFPMYEDFLRSLRMISLGELKWDESDEIINEWITYDFMFTPEEIQQERARIIAGRGDLDTAITMLEDSFAKQAASERDEQFEYYLSIYKLLQENPQHPEALKKLEARSIYWQGTKEWLNSLQ